MFLMFGVLLSQFGYTYLRRGSLEYIPQNGPAQIISPSTNATLYWSVTTGMLTAGLICLLVSGYAALSLVRTFRTKATKQFRPTPFGLFMFALGLTGMFLALFAGKCSHQ